LIGMGYVVINSAPTPEMAPQILHYVAIVLAVFAAVGWVWVRSTPQGARILVDGMDTGLRTPARLELKPGEHRVLLALAGFALGSRIVLVRGGETMQFTEGLQPR